MSSILEWSCWQNIDVKKIVSLNFYEQGCNLAETLRCFGWTERLVFYCRTTSASTGPRTPRRTCCPLDRRFRIVGSPVLERFPAHVITGVQHHPDRSLVLGQVEPTKPESEDASGKCSQERLSRGTVTSTMRRAAHTSGCVGQHILHNA